MGVVDCWLLVAYACCGMLIDVCGSLLFVVVGVCCLALLFVVVVCCLVFAVRGLFLSLLLSDAFRTLC